MSEHVDAEVMEPHDAMMSSSNLMAVTKAEIDIQIATAKNYPRTIRKFTEKAIEMVSLNEEVAQSCFYSMPRGGKPIEGPSARLAEIVASAWGNLRIAARTAGDDGKFIKCEAVCLDLERNVAAQIEVQRRITGKDGRRYNDDMIGVTSNAGTSIAYRNAVFKIVPKAYWWPVYLEARKVAIGDARTLESKRAAMIEYFGKMGITPDRVCAAVEKAGVEDIGLEELATLKGYATAIKEGEAQIESIFPPTPKPGEKKENNTPATPSPSTNAEKLAEMIGKAAE